MALLTPTKRVLTEEAHHVLKTSTSPSSSIISDDLAARLQNVGLRVRRSVNEGYATSRYGLISSIPATPFSSPTKVNTESPDTSATIFRSANDTLTAVFSSSSGGKTHPAQPRTPSPRKRGHRELDAEVDAEEEQRASASLGNEDTAMASDDEDVTIITSPSPSPTRPLRPLRKSAYGHAPAKPLVWPGNSTLSNEMDATMSTFNETSGPSRDWKDMFNQEY